jgi:hypothetical protein
VEAADANALAAVEYRHGVALTAITELAQSYMLLRGHKIDFGLRSAISTSPKRTRNW